MFVVCEQTRLPFAAPDQGALGFCPTAAGEHLYHVCSGTIEQVGRGKLAQANWDSAGNEAVGMGGGVEVLLEAAWDCQNSVSSAVTCQRARSPPPAGATKSGT